MLTTVEMSDWVWLVHVASADPQKAYDRINWIVIWSVSKVLLVVVTILVQGWMEKYMEVLENDGCMVEIAENQMTIHIIHMSMVDALGAELLNM